MHPTAEHPTAEQPAPLDLSRRQPQPERPPSSLPPMVAIQAFRTPVRGYAFASPPPGGERPASGLPAELAREPDNPADPLAVAVWALPASGGRWRIGYLDRGVAARVAPRLDAGRRVRAQLDGWSTEPEGRWRRPLLLLLPDDEEAAIGEEPPPAPGRGLAASPASNGTAIDDVPRIWGRPPGVRRRRVS